MDIKLLKEHFQNPPSEFGSIPFWAWNDRLSVEEITYQINEMKEKGMGGFFIHSREGLETEYLGDEWMKCIKGAVDAAKNAGIYAWLYDEDRFPSGGAGGEVPKNGGDRFRAKALTLEIVKGEFIDNDNILAVFQAVVAENTIFSCKRLHQNDGKTAKEREVFLVFSVKVSDPCEWFNDEAPVDNLNPEAVAEFIDTTHEIYNKCTGSEFGGTVRGIFTDEPNIADFHSVYKDGVTWLPWTTELVEYFEGKRGYDLLNYLPYLFFKGDESPKVRHDYWRTISDRFCEAYSKQLGDWCEKHNLAFTGHYLAEHNLGIAARVSGAIMPHYRYQQIPGIDLLTEQTYEYLTVKQCTSVAHQYGRRFVLSEMYGCCGWDFTFEGQKWVGDWQFVLGVNLRCQHLALYSLKGCRKRDYPPVFNYNTSWWKYNKVVEDYFSRIAAVVTEGSAIRDILVIHPSSTVWSMLGADPYEYREWEDPDLLDINRYQERFDGVVRILLGSHYDFDFGDETIMEEKGRIEGDKIFINEAGYTTVILPGVSTLFDSTVKLLLDFMSAGGKVISLEPSVTMIDGVKSGRIGELTGHKNMSVIKEAGAICSLLENVSPRRVSICNRSMVEADEFLYLLKELSDCYILFVVNNDRNNAHDVMISISAVGSVEEWMPLTGDIKAKGAISKEGKTSFKAGFGPAGSGLYIINKGEKPESGNLQFEFKQTYGARMAYTTLEPLCRFTRTSPNVLLMDVCSFKVEDGDWSENMYVWQAQSAVREMLEMRQIYYNGLPQRYRWVNKPHPGDGTLVKFKFAFYVECIPENDVYLVVEAQKNFRISLNNKEVANIASGWFIDKCFHKVELKGLVYGLNEIILSCGYRNDMEVEDCYIIGDFGVNHDRKITSEPDALHIGDWCMQGYYHYSGSIIYHYDFEYIGNPDRKVVLELGKYNAVTVEVRVNDDTAGHIPWRSANGLDISRFVRCGANKIDIEVMGSPRNVFGPFHQNGTHNPWVDWEFFKRSDSRNTPGYVVSPYGLMEQACIFIE